MVGRRCVLGFVYREEGGSGLGCRGAVELQRLFAGKKVGRGWVARVPWSYRGGVSREEGGSEVGDEILGSRGWVLERRWSWG